MSSSDSHVSHLTAMLSTASAQFSTAQQNRVGALVSHHLAWISHHIGGSWQGHPRYTSAQTVGRPWVARPADQSAVVYRHRSQSCFDRRSEFESPALPASSYFSLFTDTGVPLHEEHVNAIQEKPQLHFEILPARCHRLNAVILEDFLSTLSQEFSGGV